MGDLQLVPSAPAALTVSPAVTATLSLSAANGVDPTGVLDSTDGIARALSAASASSGLTRLLFNGVYSVSGINFDGINNVWCDFGTSTFKKNVDSSASLIRNRAGATADYGNCSNIVLTGGIIDPDQHTVGAGIVGLAYVDGLTIDGMTVLHNLPSGHADWAFQIGGRQGRISNCKVLGGDAVFEDGIHLIHGQDWLVANNYVESGDDSIAIGPAANDTRLVAHPDPIRRVTVTNNVVNSQSGYGLSIFADVGATGTNWEVSDITVQGLVGQSGVLRNGGIRIIDQNGSAAGTTQVKRIKVRGVSLAVGSTGHDDVGDPEGVLVSSASDVSVSDVALQITDGTGAATGFTGCTVTNSEDVSIDRLSCDALGKRYGIVLGSSSRVQLTRSKLRCTSSSSNGHVWVSQVRDLTIADNAFLSVPSGLFGITFSSLAGKAARGRITGNKFTKLTNASTGILASPITNFAFLSIVDNDFTEVDSATSPAYSTLVGGRSSTVNNGAGYTSAATSIVVTDGTQFQALDVIVVTRTGEAIRVNAVSSNTLTSVTRGVLGTTAAAIVDTDPIIVRSVLSRGNRNLLDYSPAFA